jgi:hypothetical protein
LKLVPAVFGKADDEAHGVALGLREHVLREFLVRASLDTNNKLVWGKH